MINRLLILTLRGLLISSVWRLRQSLAVNRIFVVKIKVFFGRTNGQEVINPKKSRVYDIKLFNRFLNFARLV